MSDESAELIDFPTSFAIKVMGHNDVDFEAHALSLVGRHTDGVAPLSVASRASKNARFVSVTIEITATSRAQLDAIYQSLSDDARVVMAL